jgi:hypothetical protein
VSVAHRPRARPRGTGQRDRGNGKARVADEFGVVRRLQGSDATNTFAVMTRRLELPTP